MSSIARLRTLPWRRLDTGAAGGEVDAAWLESWMEQHGVAPDGLHPRLREVLCAEFLAAIREGQVPEAFAAEVSASPASAQVESGAGAEQVDVIYVGGRQVLLRDDGTAIVRPRVTPDVEAFVHCLPPHVRQVVSELLLELPRRALRDLRLGEELTVWPVPAHWGGDRGGGSSYLVSLLGRCVRIESDGLTVDQLPTGDARQAELETQARERLRRSLALTGGVDKADVATALVLPEKVKGAVARAVERSAGELLWPGENLLVWLGAVDQEPAYLAVVGKHQFILRDDGSEVPLEEHHAHDFQQLRLQAKAVYEDLRHELSLRDPLRRERDSMAEVQMLFTLASVEHLLVPTESADGKAYRVAEGDLPPVDPEALMAQVRQTLRAHLADLKASGKGPAAQQVRFWNEPRRVRGTGPLVKALVVELADRRIVFTGHEEPIVELLGKGRFDVN